MEFNKMLQVRDEVNHMFDGVSQRLMGIFVNRMTHSERQLFFMILDAFGESKTFKGKFPTTCPFHFFVSASTGHLSRKVSKQSSVPGMMFVASQALEIVWGQTDELVRVFQDWVHLMTGYWGRITQRRGKHSNAAWGGTCLFGWIAVCVCVKCVGV